MKVKWGRVFLALMLLAGACGFIVLAWTQLGSGVSEGLQDARRQVEDTLEDTLEGSRGNDGAGSGYDAPERRSGERGDDASDGSIDDRPAASTDRDDSGLTPFKVLTLQYTPYMATLVHMDAGGYLEALGYDLQLYDVYSEDIDLDEAGQCEAVRSGEYDALATTLDATRKCGAGVAIGVPVGQSAGNDAIIVKDGVDSWSEIFEHALAFTDASVSEYMACFASHSSGQEIDLALRFGDASEAVDAWINSGAEQNILSVVAWEPEVSRALEAVPGSEVILSSDDVRILWDVIEFSTAKADADPLPFGYFTQAYYEALLDLSRNPDAALQKMVQWAGEDEGRQALLTTKDPAEFKADLENEAFATLRDAQALMEDVTTLTTRLEEAAFYWSYCGADVPAVDYETALIRPEFVTVVAAEESRLRGQPGDRPSARIFQVTDFTDAGAVTDDQIEAARKLFETGVEIEFQPNRTDFREPQAAFATLQNAVRFLRTCQDCLLEVQGGAAYPGSALCPSCSKEESDSLAVRRGQRVYDELIRQFDVPEAQLRLVPEPHTPQYPDSNVEEELRLDRRTFLTGYQLAGR